MDDAIRTSAARKSDVLARLDGDLDAWIATAESGRAHLVPLSLAWDGVTVILATPASSRTARNARASRQARLALGTSRDVVLIDAVVETVPCKAAAQAVAESYQARTGWDPRQEEEDHVYLLVTPLTVQAWRSLAEIEGRTLMRDGHWRS